MPTRKRLIRDEPIPEIKALKKEHAKHSANYSKKRNERFTVQGFRQQRAKTS